MIYGSIIFHEIQCRTAHDDHCLLVQVLGRDCIHFGMFSSSILIHRSRLKCLFIEQMDTFQLFGTPPFRGTSRRDIFQNITTGKLVYPPGKQTNSSKNFISRLLSDKDVRMSADEALQHEFIHGNVASRSNLKAGSSYVASLEVLKMY